MKLGAFCSVIQREKACAKQSNRDSDCAGAPAGGDESNTSRPVVGSLPMKASFG